jgi:1,3-beta-galactosyl-N-acetylhexosamine phosphorylase
MQLNPYVSEAMDYLRGWFANWCREHPHTTVVRFTALFYNFAWIWGSSPRNRHLFTDWSSYDFTVCPEALDDFAVLKGYRLTAEDFVRQGKYCAAHRVPSRQKLDWMEFISGFVRRATRELVDIIHAAGKKAYVFYDDSWVGMEPYSGLFHEMAFDGIIKCVFSGYEARLCADVDVPVHEIRFHPYLFPVGLGGAPTFSSGGTPGLDALNYWVKVRRALLRKKIGRCGLGGYLHLVEGYPDFVEAMDKILLEFDAINALHDSGPPMTLKPRIGIMTAWGSLRAWTLSGHFHETDGHILIHVLEALSGMPFDVKFLSFDDVNKAALNDINVIINAGEAGSAWSGGEHWKNADVIDELTRWVREGGVFMGIGEPSALPGFATYLRMAHVLGVDIDNGEKSCHGRWAFEVDENCNIGSAVFPARDGVHLTDGTARVLAAVGNTPTYTVNKFGKGTGIYLSGFTINEHSAHAFRSILSKENLIDNPHVECAVFAKKIAFINNSSAPQKASCTLKNRLYDVELKPYEMKEIDYEPK